MPRPQRPTLPVAPKRQTDKTPVTPIIGDLILSEVEDYSRKKLPEYGSKHPKKSNSDPTQYKFPDHELVLIRPVVNERDGIFEFIYAAKREDQDKYNFEFTQADIGGARFDAVKRDYLIKRDDFTPQTPAMGTAMTDVPSGRFSASSYVLANRQQIRTNDELDALYILERRTYVKKVTVTTIQNEAKFGGSFSKIETLYYRGETVDGSAIETQFTTENYWDTSAAGLAKTGTQLTANWFLISTVTYSDPVDQDLWTFTQADIGGNKFNAISLTAVTTKSSYTIATPAMGAALSSDGPTLGGVTYVLAERTAIPTGDQTVDKVFVVERLVYVKKVVITTIKNDAKFGGSFTNTETLYYRGETVDGATVETQFATATYWDTSAAGLAKVGNQLTENWFSIATVIYEEPAAQDLWTFTQADIGGSKFNSISLTAVTTKSSYTIATPTMGSTLSGDGPGLGGVTYVLAERNAVPTGDQTVDKVFVVERLVYVKKVVITTIQNDSRFGGSFTKTDTLYYRGETVDGAAVEMQFGTEAYWDTSAAGLSKVGNQLTENWFSISTVIYEEPAAQDLWTFTQADIGGNKFDAISLTEVTTKSSYTIATPAMGAVLSSDGPALGGETYVLAERNAIPTGDQVVDKVLVVERRVYVKKVSLVAASFDELSKRTLHTTQTLYYKGEPVSEALSVPVEAVFADTDNSFWAASIDAPVSPATIGFGVIYEGRQLTDNWFLIVKRQSIAGAYSAGILTVESGLITTKNYSWPPVLSEFEIMDWDKRDGSTDYRVRYAFDPAGYSGPCKVSVTTTWALVLPSGADTKAKQLEGKSVSYSCPYFSVNIPPCLRPAITLVCDIGTTHPIFKHNVGSSRTFPGTTELEWADVLADVSVTAYRGGYLVTKTTISPPSTATS